MDRTVSLASMTMFILLLVCAGVYNAFGATTSGMQPTPSDGSNSTKWSCDDDDVCTWDYEDGEGGCFYEPVDCDDGNPSTIDTCDPYIGCINTPLDCDDNNACTEDLTDGLGGCVHFPVDCNDNDVCTIDTCDSQTGCNYEWIWCDDDNACTSNDCDPDTGCVYVPYDCNDDNPSTIDTCDPYIGCINTPINCDDNNACTEDTTDGLGGCLHYWICEYHLADTNNDWKVVMSEAIAYLAGWQQGANPMAYAIRAAYLWQNGEWYAYNGSLEPPMCWELHEPEEGEGEVPMEGEYPTETILLPGNVPLELVRIPAGSFQMGSPDTERSRESDEGPVHTVTIDYDFYISKYEVTQQQWLAVAGSWPGEAPSSDYGLGDLYPAYNVNWYNVKDWCTKLTQHLRNTEQGSAQVRLPSEAEWEYACRAGTQTRFFFGDSLNVTDACEYDAVRSQYMWYCATRTAVVGGKLPNAFGLHDMSGNVDEWCEDDWHDDYTSAPSNGSAWRDSPRGSYRVFRGGNWYHNAHYCRSASRKYVWPGGRYYSIGFRLAR